jgi:hypothetical protein
VYYDPDLEAAALAAVEAARNKTCTVYQHMHNGVLVVVHHTDEGCFSVTTLDGRRVGVYS